jgi:two-component sensor histidine kinase
MLGATARSTSSADEFYRSFTARIEALARTHAMITGANGQAASLRDLLWSELEAFDDASHKRIRLEGPDIQLSSAVAVPFGMAFHELTINAVKFGALSAAEGHVEVRWVIQPDPGGETLHIEWLEQGGPRVKEPTHQGLGSRLVKRVLTTQVGGEVKTEYRPDGLHFTLDAPLNCTIQP